MWFMESIEHVIAMIACIKRHLFQFITQERKIKSLSFLTCRVVILPVLQISCKDPKNLKVR